MRTAVNDNGDVIELQGNEWVPVRSAVNDQGQRLNLIDGQWQAAQQPPVAAGLSTGQYVGGIADQVVGGLSLGFNDELEAGLKSLWPEEGTTYLDRYSRNVEQVRNRMSGFRNENPKVAAGSEMVGGFATGIGTAARMPYMVAKSLPKALGIGAIEGAVQGAGNADGRDILPQMAKGAALGGVVGGGLYGGSELLTRIARYGPEALVNIPGIGKYTKDYQPAGDMAQRNLKTVEDLGFQIAPGDKINSSSLQKFEDSLKKNWGGAGPHQNRVDHNQDLAQEIVAKELGIPGPDIDLGKARQVNNAAFAKVANSGAKIDLDEQFIRDVDGIRRGYQSAWGKNGKSKLFDDVMDEVDAGNITARRYQDLMGRLSDDMYKASNRGDGAQVRLYRELQKALDDAADRSLPKQDYIDFHKARQAFRARKTLSGRGVVNPADGSLSIPALGNAMKKNNDFVHGYDTTDMAQIGRFHLGYKSGIGDSGTATGSIAALPGAAIAYPISRGLNAVPNKMWGRTGAGQAAQQGTLGLIPGIEEYFRQPDKNKR